MHLKLACVWTFLNLEAGAAFISLNLCILLGHLSCFIIKSLSIVFVLLALKIRPAYTLEESKEKSERKRVCVVSRLTTSHIKPSSGFGSLSNNPMLVKTVEIFKDGCQAPCAHIIRVYMFDLKKGTFACHITLHICT